MRVRRLELRLLAAVLAGLWTAACFLLLGWYRPGGPLDLAIGIAVAVPALIAVAAVAWPPRDDGRRVPAATWLGLLAALILAPLVAGVAATAAGGEPQAIIASPEVAYAWLIAIAGTSLFTALGLAGRRAVRSSGRRLATTGMLAAVLVASSAGLMGGAALANAAAMQDRPAASSPYGPTDPDATLPACRDAPVVGATATVAARLWGEADRASLGDATIQGTRDGGDVAWTAEVATTAAAGPAGAVAIGPDGWMREPGAPWGPVPVGSLAAEHLDATVVAAALQADRLVAAEDRGLVRVRGAPARHCRVAVDGEIFRAAFPQVRWFADDRALHRWRGELDYYVFGDGQLGLVEAWVNGEAAPVAAGAIQATIRARLEATNRGEQVTLAPPAGG